MKQICTLLLLFVALQAGAQTNLVPNAGFEDYDNCPDGGGEIRCPLNPFPPFPPTLISWISAYQNSPDYYNVCSGNTYSTVPDNYFGHHPAHNGNAYAAFIAYGNGADTSYPSYYTECIGTPLLEGLQEGKVYKISCFVKLVYKIDQLHAINIIAPDYLQALFTDTPFTAPAYPASYPATKLRATTRFIDDTNDWVEITGYYTARGGEQHVSFGLFYEQNDKPTFKQVFPPTHIPLTPRQAYYFIDDIALAETLPCDTTIYSHDTTLCALPDSNFLVMSSDAGADSFRWNDAAGTSSKLIRNFGKHWCIASRGCNAVIDTFTIDFASDGLIIERRIKGLDTTICADDEISLQVGDSFLAQATGNYYWSTGDSSCCIQITDEGQYILTIEGFCDTYRDTINVKKENCTDCIFIPDAFTPNKDGINDYFRVIARCGLSSFKLVIYNRWGQQVFATDDINTSWNGLYKADFAEMGTYFYYVEYTTPLDTEQQFVKGDIILIR